MVILEMNRVGLSLINSLSFHVFAVVFVLLRDFLWEFLLNLPFRHLFILFISDILNLESFQLLKIDEGLFSYPVIFVFQVLYNFISSFIIFFQFMVMSSTLIWVPWTHKGCKGFKHFELSSFFFGLKMFCKSNQKGIILCILFFCPTPLSSDSIFFFTILGNLVDPLAWILRLHGCK